MTRRPPTDEEAAAPTVVYSLAALLVDSFALEEAGDGLAPPDLLSTVCKEIGEKAADLVLGAEPPSTT